ncbi:hypothetical protein [Sphingopyxis sp. 550A]
MNAVAPIANVGHGGNRKPDQEANLPLEPVDAPVSSPLPPLVAPETASVPADLSPSSVSRGIDRRASQEPPFPVVRGKQSSPGNGTRLLLSQPFIVEDISDDEGPLLVVSPPEIPALRPG